MAAEAANAVKNFVDAKAKEAEQALANAGKAIGQEAQKIGNAVGTVAKKAENVVNNAVSSAKKFFSSIPW